MADAAFDRAVINVRERPLSSDINQLQSERDRTLREFARSLYLAHAAAPDIGDGGYTPRTGFMASGFMVTPVAPLQYQIQAGLGFFFDALYDAADIGGVSKVDDHAPFAPIYLAAPQAISSPSDPGVGQERVDIIEVKLDRRLQDNSSRDILNPSTGIFEPTLVLKTLAYSLDGRIGQVASPSASTTGISIKSGALQAEETFKNSNGVTGVPATTAGYTKIATILVPAGGAVPQGNIRDERFLLSPGGIHHLGFKITQVPGTNDTFTIGTRPQIPAGMRLAIRQVISPSNGGTFRVYIFGGQLNTNGSGTVVASVHAATIANANRLARTTALQFGVMSDTERSQLIGPTGTTAYTAAWGQQFAFFDMDGTRLIDSGDTSDATRVFDVQVTLTSV